MRGVFGGFVLFFSGLLGFIGGFVLFSGGLLGFIGGFVLFFAGLLGFIGDLCINVISLPALSYLFRSSKKSHPPRMAFSK
ncbi:hypothetical protein ACFSUM_03590 [Virgibacillus siamensis]|uniref:hypothetical protein n=1 Tax=Virgibacillus siamensis TaxID=480071 RepID=UPI0031D8FB63